MQLEVIGVGGAGCRIADAIHGAGADSFVGSAFAFDTDSEAVSALSSIPVANRHRYGDVVEGGLEGNLQEGVAVGEEYVDELSRELDRGQPSTADAFLVCLGLGGATGGGTAPALVSNLETLYDHPVYVLATLPAACELEPPVANPAEPRRQPGGESNPRPDGVVRPLAEENAVRTLDRLEGVADALVAFDNEEWLRADERPHRVRDRLNGVLAERVSALFAAVAGAGGAAADAENVVDGADLARVLGSRSSVATIGYGAQEVETGGGSRFGLGLFSSGPSVDTGSAVSAVETAINKALHGRLTLECERSEADRGLLLVGGPPAWLNRKAIAEGRRTVESATGSMEVLSGDVPRPDGDRVFAVVVLAGVDGAARLEALRSRTRPFERDRRRRKR